MGREAFPFEMIPKRRRRYRGGVYLRTTEPLAGSWLLNGLSTRNWRASRRSVATFGACTPAPFGRNSIYLCGDETAEAALASAMMRFDRSARSV